MEWNTYISYTLLLFNVNGTEKGLYNGGDCTTVYSVDKSFPVLGDALAMDRAMCDLRHSVTYQNGSSKAVFLNTDYTMLPRSSWTKPVEAILTSLSNKMLSILFDRDIAALRVRN